MDAILFYEGKWYFFSNLSSFAVEIYNAVWPTAEHAYQAAKFSDKAIREEILHARSAYAAKKIAHKYHPRRKSDWNKMKLDVMEKILRAKLTQHPFIREKLLDSGDMPIIEDSFKDSFWGRGADWKGINHLGKLWMKLRDEIREEIAQEEVA